MNTVVRTTITIPEDIYRQLRQEAQLLGTSFSGLITKKVSGKNQVKPGSSLLNLAGKFSVKKFKVVSREEIYDEIDRHKMSFGH
ncbi:hypothetical protein HY440_02315 [Candidatus Microgenomates bacterium]|nr:hypothetical protein [Candidatus Microgenomates bacterium]